MKVDKLQSGLLVQFDDTSLAGKISKEQHMYVKSHNYT